MEYLYKDLVNKAKKGSRDAAEELIARLKPLIYSAIKRYKRDYDTEDLYQEACIILLEAIRNFDEERKVPFLAFARSRIYYGIHNLTRKEVKMQSLDQPLWEEDGQSLLDKLEDTKEGVEELMVRAEIYESLRDGIKLLTQKQRDVIISHYFEGKKLKDIAKDRGIHYKTVLGLKDRAIKELYLCLRNTN